MRFKLGYSMIINVLHVLKWAVKDNIRVCCCFIGVDYFILSYILLNISITVFIPDAAKTVNSTIGKVSSVKSSRPEKCPVMYIIVPHQGVMHIGQSNKGFLTDSGNTINFSLIP
ncbi:hypothetical protein RCC89_10105 [Cytophagaceae bacterium ABcell3]|nr:hypothetical protein RCC89_10105 [Cytophagaceae bacterium ABcell3]